MKKRTFAADEQLFIKHAPQIALLASIFIVGAILGSLFAVAVPGLAQAKLTTYSIRLTESGFSKVFASIFLPNVALATAIFISVFFKAGTLFTCIVFLAKGFGLSLLITTLAKVYGVSGYLVSVSAEALAAFVIITCLMLIAVRAMALSGGTGRRSVSSAAIAKDSGYIVTAVFSVFVIIAISILYALVSPVIAGVAFGIIK